MITFINVKTNYSENEEARLKQVLMGCGENCRSVHLLSTKPRLLTTPGLTLGGLACSQRIPPKLATITQTRICKFLVADLTHC